MNRNILTTALRRAALGVVVAGALILAVPVAMAQGPGDPGLDDDGNVDGPWVGPRFERLASRLELTEQQQQAIIDIREQTRTKNLAIGKQLLQLRNELEGALLADKIDDGKVLGLVEQIGKVRTELQKNRMGMRLEIGKELTPQQRDQMLMLRQGRAGGGWGDGDRWRGHGRNKGFGPGHGRGGRGGGEYGVGRGPYGRAGSECDGDGPYGRPDAKCDGEGPHGRATRS